MMMDYHLSRLLIGGVLFELIIATGLQRGQYKFKCLPVNATIFWDRSNVRDTFNVQRHYILDIVNNTVDGSTVRLNTFGKDSIVPIKQDIKEKDNLKRWQKTITDIAVGISEPHMIHASTLIESIADYKDKSSIGANVVFLVVNNQTKVDHENKLVEGLNTYETFVVFYGRQEQSKFWKCIATDDNHFLNPDDNLNANVKPFFRSMCYGLQRGQNKFECLPVNATIFWDRSNVRDTFNVQRHYILDIVNNTVDGSTVRLDTFGKDSIVPIKQDIKDKDNLKRWEKAITDVAVGISEPHMIHASTLIESIADYQDKSSFRASVVFLVVNNQTKVDHEDKLVKGLNNYEMFVVFYGRQEQSKFWKGIASDDNHFLNPDDNLKANVKPFFRSMCYDSKLRCNKDMYWNAHDCFTCTQICVMQSSYGPKFCREVCQNNRPKEDPESEGNKSQGLFSNWNIVVLGRVVLFYWKTIGFD